MRQPMVVLRGEGDILPVHDLALVQIDHGIVDFGSRSNANTVCNALRSSHLVWSGEPSHRLGLGRLLDGYGVEEDIVVLPFDDIDCLGNLTGGEGIQWMWQSWLPRDVGRHLLETFKNHVGGV